MRAGVVRLGRRAAGSLSWSIRNYKEGLALWCGQVSACFQGLMADRVHRCPRQIGVAGFFAAPSCIYGIIALFTSLNQYIGLFILAISGTIFKFVSIEYNKDENINETNKYYSTSFFSLIFIVIILTILIISLSPLLKSI